MKNRKKFRIIVGFLVMVITGFVLQAQAQTSQDLQLKAEHEKQIKEKDKRLQHVEMQMKKQHLEQEKIAAERERLFLVQERAPLRSSGWSSSWASPSFGSNDSDDGPFFRRFPEQENQSRLTLRNSFNGETVNSSGEFEVDQNTKHFRLMASGQVRHGEISLKVFYPGGKVFKDLSINSSAEISFSQSLTIKEEEKKKYSGTWKYEVKTKTAEGSYRLSIMTH